MDYKDLISEFAAVECEYCYKVFAMLQLVHKMLLSSMCARSALGVLDAVEGPQEALKTFRIWSCSKKKESNQQI